MEARIGIGDDLCMGDTKWKLNAILLVEDTVLIVEKEKKNAKIGKRM